ncbi:CoA-transferase [Xanthobacter sediminis]
MSKVMSAAAAVGAIRDGATVAVGGTGAVLEPDLVLEALDQRFRDSGAPKALALFAPMSPGDRLNVGGLNAFAHSGMVRRFVGSSFSMQRHPAFIEMIRDGAFEAYTIGMGTAIQLLTAAAARKPYVYTTAGVGSFLDPRVEGGCMNAASTTPPVSVQTIAGVDWLRYDVQPIDVAIIRATTADENGYLSFEEEPNTLGMLEVAAAAKANGGTVIAQVKRLARAGSLDPRLVRVPGVLVDAVVVHPTQTQVSPKMADPRAGWNPALAGAMKVSYADIAPMGGGSEKAILRRAALELRRGDVVNLGAGVATHLPRIALEEGFLDDVVFTNEHGVFGGLMATALGGSFVPALNAEAVMDSAFQFDFYEAGGLDITFLGVGQIDADGNVNVSKFGREWNGPGGFCSIVERTRRLVFCGALTAGGLKVETSPAGVSIRQEGKVRKWVPKVEQVTLNARRAFAQGQEVRYITERAVFALTESGPTLIEIAPGVDLERDVKAQIGFPITVADTLRTMDRKLYAEGPIGLAAALDAPAGAHRRAS